jgi:hypothetical protein
MEEYRVHCNLIRDHQTLGVIPGVMVGLAKIDSFRWLEILMKVTNEF